MLSCMLTQMVIRYTCHPDDILCTAVWADLNSIAGDVRKRYYPGFAARYFEEHRRPAGGSSLRRIKRSSRRVRGLFMPISYYSSSCVSVTKTEKTYGKLGSEVTI